MVDLPRWSDVTASLAAAVRASLPLGLRKAAGDQISALGLHIDAFDGHAGLYLLPSKAVAGIGSEAVDNLGDWPISTDWNRDEDFATAFAKHWDPWAEWVAERRDVFSDSESGTLFRGLLRVGCEAVRDLESLGFMDILPKADGFKVIILEHDEPVEFGLERYRLFLETGKVRCHGDDDPPGE